MRSGVRTWLSLWWLLCAATAAAQTSAVVDRAAIGCSDVSATSPLCVSGLPAGAGGAVLLVDSSGLVRTAGGLAVLVTTSSGHGVGAYDALSGGTHLWSLTRQTNDVLLSAYGSIQLRSDATTGPTSGSLANLVNAQNFLPGANYFQNLGSASAKFLSFHGAELVVDTLVAQSVMSTIGGRILVGPTTVLAADLSNSATSISVKHNSLASGDRVYLEANGNVEFLAITSSASGSGPYTYTVTRNLDGSGANTWVAGDGVFNTGQPGNGWIDLYSTRGVKASTEVGPTIVGNERLSSTYNDWAARWGIGNLRGLCNYSTGSNIFGAFFGDCTHAHVTIDPVNGVRIRNGSTNLLQADASGNLSLTGSLSAGGSGSFGAGGVTLDANGIVISDASSAGDTPHLLRFGNHAVVGWYNSRLNVRPFGRMDLGSESGAFSSTHEYVVLRGNNGQVGPSGGYVELTVDGADTTASVRLVKVGNAVANLGADGFYNAAGWVGVTHASPAGTLVNCGGFICVSTGP